eukprot:TRINITY_DN2366_c0_g1_i1.p1 TRINITY_DN2366_c0_g1~~TRINITY_DN2366_c0_g1_i1.p1  ORF type:complete len:150 (+),score=21.14 TRINITY_DN2366_c0_g1_i1:63-512(+)
MAGAFDDQKLPSSSESLVGRTLSVFIKADQSKIFNFVSNPENWPVWAVHNVIMVEKDPSSDSWLFTGPTGVSRVNLHTQPELGIFDQEFIVDLLGISFRVPSRVTTVSPGCSVVMMSFMKPPMMGVEDFDMGMTQVQAELDVLRTLMED